MEVFYKIMVSGKQIKIDQKQLRKLVEKGWTEPDISDFFGCAIGTINKKCPGSLKRGRPRKIITDEIISLVLELSSIHCTEEEIAAVLNISKPTFEKWKGNPEFLDALKRGREKGKASLRRKRYAVAMGDDEKGILPNTTMLIWLSKQMLGERDNYDQKIDTTSNFGVIYLPPPANPEDWNKSAEAWTEKQVIDPGKK